VEQVQQQVFGEVGEVANGLAHSALPLAIVPTRTANDLARNLAIPKQPVAVARLAATGAPRPIDLGEVQTRQNTRLFVKVAGFGFDAEAAWRADRLPRIVGGTLPYLIGVAQTLRQLTSPRVRLRLDGQPLEARVLLVAVGNCASYAGGMRIVPPARPDDGALDVCVVQAVGRLEVLRVIPRLYSGGHLGHRAVELFRCRTLEAEVDVTALGVFDVTARGGPSAAVPARVLCHADGEQVGDLPVRFVIRPAALRCLTGPAPDRAL
jgi:diacylglycerol kinase (ATP)